MKNLVSVIFCALLFSSSYAQSGKPETITIKTKIYCDHCLQCGSCGANINNAIRETKGIRKVKINSKENTITVKYKPGKTSPEKIRRAIADIGYDADEIKADATAYSKLDGCCKAP